jgi:hypothetical protein
MFGTRMRRNRLEEVVEPNQHQPPIADRRVVEAAGGTDAVFGGTLNADNDRRVFLALKYNDARQIDGRIQSQGDRVSKYAKQAILSTTAHMRTRSENPSFSFCVSRYKGFLLHTSLVLPTQIYIATMATTSATRVAVPHTLLDSIIESIVTPGTGSGTMATLNGCLLLLIGLSVYAFLGEWNAQFAIVMGALAVILLGIVNW